MSTEEFLHRLSLRVQSMLVTAATSDVKKRSEILSELFGNLIFQIEDSILENLATIRGSASDDGLCRDCQARLGPSSPIYYYDLLSSYFYHHTSEAEELQSVVSLMWTQPLASVIFALLFHKWIMKNEENQTSRRGNVLGLGLNRLFWEDLEHGHLVYKTVFDHMFSVLQSPTHGDAVYDTSVYNVLFECCSKFYFYYFADEVSCESLKEFIEAATRTKHQLGHSDTTDTESSPDRLIGYIRNVRLQSDVDENGGAWEEGIREEARSDVANSPSIYDEEHIEELDTCPKSPIRSGEVGKLDVDSKYIIEPICPRCGHSQPQPTANEVEISQEELTEMGGLVSKGCTHMLKKIHDEKQLALYVKQISAFAEISLPVAEWCKLNSTVYFLSSPGGPFYAPRPVRHAAVNTLQLLTPEGTLSRSAVYTGFRMVWFTCPCLIFPAASDLHCRKHCTLVFEERRECMEVDKKLVFLTVIK